MRKDGEPWGLFSLDKRRLRGILSSIPANNCKAGATDSFQWWPTGDQGAMGTNWNANNKPWTWEKTLLLWGWQITGVSCLESLWSLRCRYSGPKIFSCATYPREHALGGGWPGGFPEVSSNPNYSVSRGRYSTQKSQLPFPIYIQVKALITFPITKLFNYLFYWVHLAIFCTGCNER